MTLWPAVVVLGAHASEGMYLMICRLCSKYATSSASKEKTSCHSHFSNSSRFQRRCSLSAAVVYASSGQVHLLRISCTKSIQTNTRHPSHGWLPRRIPQLILRWCSELTVPPVHGSTGRSKPRQHSFSQMCLGVRTQALMGAGPSMSRSTRHTSLGEYQASHTVGCLKVSTRFARPVRHK